MYALGASCFLSVTKYRKVFKHFQVLDWFSNDGFLNQYEVNITVGSNCIISEELV